MNDPSGQALRSQLAESHHAVTAFFAGLTEAEARHRLDPEAWRPVDDLRHLTMSSIALTWGLRLSEEELAERFGAGDGVSRSCAEITAMTGAALARGAKSPERLVPEPESPEDTPALLDRCVSEWQVAASELEAALASWGEEMLDRVRLPHPFLGPLTLREWLCFNHIHARHHVRVAKRRLGRPD